jgi:hypothetical protein
MNEDDVVVQAMREGPEFAEEYTFEERMRFVVLGVVAGVLVIGFGKLWVFPALQRFADIAPCRTVFGLDGVTVLFHGLLVGIPVLSAVVAGATFGWRGFKILKDGQAPPRGERVMRRVRIERGAKAKVQAYLHMLFVVPFIAMACWGYFQALQLEAQARQRPHVCEVPFLRNAPALHARS